MKFQFRVFTWLTQVFIENYPFETPERNFRFIEEAIELVQSLGCSKEDVLKLVDYVYDRPVGVPFQEVGGTMVTLAALCQINNIDMEGAAEVELTRINRPEVMEKIKSKQLSKRMLMGVIK